MYRLAVYKNERKKFAREIGIRKIQDALLKKNFAPNSKKLIVFLVPGSDWETGKDKISGGTISIVSVCEETAATQEAATILCTMRGDHLFTRHEMFENNTPVFRFTQLPLYFNQAEEVLIHIPEFMAAYFVRSISRKDLAWLQRMKWVHFNIMNQNIRLMPDKEVIGSLRKIAQEFTITTAHQKYCNTYYRDYYGVPIHKLSVWISPDQYQFKTWRQKENLMVVSPDEKPWKAKILDKLSRVPGLTITIIRNLTYEQYKALIARAKWSLTFGEGLDGYLIEPVFSGAVGFAVYNEEFFTPDFKGLPAIYNSYEELYERIPEDMHALDNEHGFKACQQEQFNICARYYSRDQYRKNIDAFYRKEYTYG